MIRNVKESLSENLLKLSNVKLVETFLQIFVKKTDIEMADFIPRPQLIIPKLNNFRLLFLFGWTLDCGLGFYIFYQRPILIIWSTIIKISFRYLFRRWCYLWFWDRNWLDCRFGEHIQSNTPQRPQLHGTIRVAHCFFNQKQLFRNWHIINFKKYYNIK